MKNKNKIKQLITATSLAAMASTPTWAADVTIGEPSWPGAKATAYLVKVVAEQELGLEVAITPGNNAVIFKAMDGGKGDIDVHPELWLPNQQNLADKYTKERNSVTVSANPYYAFQGACVNKAAADLGIKSVFDLVDPDTAQMFDSDGDGKGEYWVGGTGWASSNVEKVKAKSYGFAEFFEMEAYSESLAMAKLDDAVNKNNPWVGFCYKPHHIFKLYEMTELEEPDYDASKWVMFQPDEGADWYEKSDVPVAWPEASVHLAWSKSLETRSPELVQLLSNIQIDSNSVSGLIYDLSVAEMEAHEAAKQWVAANPDKVKAWLGL